MISHGLFVPKAAYGVVDMLWPIVTYYLWECFFAAIAVRDVIVSFYRSSVSERLSFDAGLLPHVYSWGSGGLISFASESIEGD